MENQKGDKFKRVARTLSKLLVIGTLRKTVLIPLFSFEVVVDQNLGTLIQQLMLIEILFRLYKLFFRYFFFRKSEIRAKHITKRLTEKFQT